MQEKREEGEKKEEEGNKAAAAAAVEEKKDDEKKEEEGGAAQEIVLKVDMHCEACARKVARALKGFQGALSPCLLDLILHISFFYFCSFHDGSIDKVSLLL